MVPLLAAFLHVAMMIACSDAMSMSASRIAAQIWSMQEQNIDFEIGDDVRVPWLGIDHGFYNELYEARVEDRADDGTYEVLFRDGNKLKGIPFYCIQGSVSSVIEHFSNRDSVANIPNDEFETKIRAADSIVAIKCLERRRQERLRLAHEHIESIEYVRRDGPEKSGTSCWCTPSNEGEYQECTVAGYEEEKDEYYIMYEYVNFSEWVKRNATIVRISNTGTSVPCNSTFNALVDNASTIVDHFAQCGFVQVSNLFSPELLQMAKRKAFKIRDTNPDLYQSLLYNNLRADRVQFFPPFNNEVFRDKRLLGSKLVDDIVLRYLRRGMPDAVPSFDMMTMVNANPWSESQDMHTDVPTFGSISLHIPLRAFTEDQGVLEFCERSHSLLGISDRNRGIQACFASNSSKVRHAPLLSLGSGIFYDSSTYHRSKAHESNVERWALYLSFDAGNGLDYSFPPAARDATMAFREEYARLRSGGVDGAGGASRDEL